MVATTLLLVVSITDVEKEKEVSALQHSKYGFSKTIDVPYEEAVEKARAALAEDAQHCQSMKLS